MQFFSPLFLLFFSLGVWLLPAQMVQAQTQISKADKKPPFLNQLNSHEQFLSMSRLYKQGRFKDVPHIMFLVARDQKKVYFINSQQYEFHGRFARSQYLTLEDDHNFFKNNYSGDKRRFILGNIVYQAKRNQYIIELWEGDITSPIIWQDCWYLLQQSFPFAALAIKPNSLQQEEAIKKAVFTPPSAANNPAKDAQNTQPQVQVQVQPQIVTWQDMFALHDVEIVNAGKTVGKLVKPDTAKIQSTKSLLDTKPEEIVWLSELPLALSPVSGVITSQPSIFLSHVNVLTQGWNIPNLYIKDAEAALASYTDKWIYLEAKQDPYRNEATGTYTIRLATDAEIADKQKELAQKRETQKKALRMPRADLSYRALTDLKNQKAADIDKFGAKAANLGEVYQAKIPNVTVPDGFSVPFVHYQEFVEKNHFREQIIQAVQETDPTTKQALLQKLRADFIAAPFDTKLAQEIIDKVHKEYADVGVFVRSSTNAEDLAGFSGAGLYTTVPNVKYATQGDEAILQAIKTVWASIWNDAAVSARDAVGIVGEAHLQIYASVLLQKGINADSAGVLITTNPYQAEETDTVYINAKRGLGIKVVEGKKIPEQVLYRPKSGAIVVLTRSMDDTMLTFDADGGVREVTIEENRAVLTDATIKKLSTAAQKIDGLFMKNYKKQQKKSNIPHVAQDIEWLIVGEQIYIVQARPFAG